MQEEGKEVWVADLPGTPCGMLAVVEERSRGALQRGLGIWRLRRSERRSSWLRGAR